MRFGDMMDVNSSWWACFLGTARWIGFRLDFISSGIVAIMVALTLSLRESVRPEIVALAFSHVLQLRRVARSQRPPWPSAGMTAAMHGPSRRAKCSRVNHQPVPIHSCTSSPAVCRGTLMHMLIVRLFPMCSGLMQWAVRQTAEMENLMTSTERIDEYTILVNEAPEAEHDAVVPPHWPHAGDIEYRDVFARYRPGLKPVLRGLSFRLEGGSRCGVVGRTGSGKSSLMLTLFRLIDVTRGHILIDGVDTADLGTERLRSALAIIPQVGRAGGCCRGRSALSGEGDWQLICSLFFALI